VVDHLRLDGVERRQPDLDQIGQDRRDLPVGVHEDGQPCLAERLEQARQPGLDQRPPRRGREQHVLLRAVIVAEVAAIHAQRDETPDQDELDLGDAVQQRAREARIERRIGQERLEAAQQPGALEQGEPEIGGDEVLALVGGNDPRGVVEQVGIGRVWPGERVQVRGPGQRADAGEIALFLGVEADAPPVIASPAILAQPLGEREVEPDQMVAQPLGQVGQRDAKVGGQFFAHGGGVIHLGGEAVDGLVGQCSAHALSGRQVHAMRSLLDGRAGGARPLSRDRRVCANLFAPVGRG